MSKHAEGVKFLNKADEERFKAEWDYWSELVKELTKGKTIYIVSSDERYKKIWDTKKYY